METLEFNSKIFFLSIFNFHLAKRHGQRVTETGDCSEDDFSQPVKKGRGPVADILPSTVSKMTILQNANNLESSFKFSLKT